MGKKGKFQGKQSYDGFGEQDNTLTPAELIKTRLLQAFDPNYRESAYQQMRYMFGLKWSEGRTGSYVDGDFPNYPDIYVRYQEVGRSRKILSNQFIGLSRVMYADPEPESPGVDKYTAEVRKQAYLSRYRKGEWGDETAPAYMEGDGLGLGFVQFCLKTNTQTGMQRVHMRHSPLVYTLWDRFERSPGRARWVCFVRHLPVDDAAMIFGRDVAEANKVNMVDSNDSWAVEVVRYFEYYDTGAQGGKPTRALILGSMSAEPVRIEENVFGCLPFAYYSHFWAPGMRYPIGKVALQMSSQEAINELERAFRKAVRQGPVTVADERQIDLDDLRMYNAGDVNRILKWLVKAGVTLPPIQRIPGAEVSQSVIKLYEIMDRQNTTDSGVTDFDRGENPQSSRTLGENELVDQRGQTQASWSELQAMRFHVRCVEKAFLLMKNFDRDPVTLDIFGKRYLCNDPTRPDSSLASWLEEESDVIINTDALRYQDVQATKQARLNQLVSVAQFVGPQGALDIRWFAEELARALGEQDPKQAINSALLGQGPAAPAPGVPGAPLPGGGGVPGGPVVVPGSVPPGSGPPPPPGNPAFRTPPMAPPPPGVM
jgi:hypothetical protein